MPLLDEGFSVDVLSLKDQVGITTGVDAPTAGTGVDLPIGSLFLQQNQTTNQTVVWKKVGPLPTDWAELTTPANGTPGTGFGRLLAHGKIPPKTGTTRIALDLEHGTVGMFDPPSITEGTELWSATVTPSSANSVIEISTAGMIGIKHYEKTHIVLAAFRDTTCIGAIAKASVHEDKLESSSVYFRILDDQHNTTAPITYSVRIGRGGSKNRLWMFNHMIIREKGNYWNKAQALGGVFAENGYKIVEYI